MSFIKDFLNMFSSKKSKRKRRFDVNEKNTQNNTGNDSGNTNMNYDEQISHNFKLYEFLNSQTAKRKNIDNTPTPQHYVNLKVLVKELLQPLRTDLGKSIIITSGYRSKALNDEIGGSKTSQHCKGEAADIECIGMSNVELAKYIRDNYDFDQLILEFYNPSEGPNSGWVHVSFSADGNRKEVLTALSENGTTKYVYGIAA